MIQLSDFKKNPVNAVLTGMALVLLNVGCNEERIYPNPLPTDVSITTLSYSGVNYRISAGDFEKDTLVLLDGIPEDGEWDYTLDIGGFSEQGVVSVTDSKAKFANFLRIDWWLNLEGDENDSIDISIELISETLGYESGTFTCKFKKDMYNIYTWQDLQAMQYDLDGEYTIKKDIEFPDPAEDGFPEQGFIPVGSSNDESAYFSGILNGDGYSLIDFYINREFLNFVGVFGVLSYTAEITNLKIELSDLGVTGYNYVGALAGYANENTVIEDCKVEGDVYGNSYTGGLVGYIGDNSSISLCRMTGNVTGTNCTGGVIGYCTTGSNIEYCFSEGNITGTDSVGGLIGSALGNIANCQGDSVSVSGNSYTGGLVGWCNGTLTYCSTAAGKVAGDSMVGGLVGVLESDGSISQSCNKTNVSGQTYAGGIVGINHGEVLNSYSCNGTVEGTAVAGGFIGLSDNLVKNCYASMETSASSVAGGFIGDKDGTVTNCYWNSDNSSLSAVGNGTTYGIEDETSDTFLNFSPSDGGVREIFLGWDFSDIWAILSSKNEGYPYLLIERTLALNF